VIDYYLEKWIAEEKVRQFNEDVLKLQPAMDHHVKDHKVEVEQKAQVFPLVYANITVTYNKVI
jgi:hypothetical protein